MAATYTAGDTGARNRVRVLLGDTPPGGESSWPEGVLPLFQDEELDDFLVQESDSINNASALAMEILARRFARQYDTTIDGASFRRGSISDRYMKAAARLRMRTQSGTVVMPRRKDGYSDDVDSDEVSSVTATVISRELDW